MDFEFLYVGLIAEILFAVVLFFFELFMSSIKIFAESFYGKLTGSRLLTLTSYGNNSILAKIHPIV